VNTEFLVLAFTAVALGGLIKGLSGFGYAVVSTTLLALFFPAQKAVAFMIIPLVAIQLELITQLEKEEIKTCTNNFEVYIAALAAGTLTGFYAVTSIPGNIIKPLIGTLTLLFTLSQVKKLDPHIQKLKKKCFRRSNLLQLPLGFMSGLIFGATNIGVQIVAYLKTMELDRRKFIGLLALIMVPISLLRLPLILEKTGLELIAYSILAAPLGVLAAWLGNKTAQHIPKKTINLATISLLLIISLKLISSAAL
jgi:uncharacterized membrane protein YfcA